MDAEIGESDALLPKIFFFVLYLHGCIWSYVCMYAGWCMYVGGRGGLQGA